MYIHMYTPESCMSIFINVSFDMSQRNVQTWLGCTFRVLQCVAVCCSVLQCVAVCCSTFRFEYIYKRKFRHVSTKCMTTYINNHAYIDMYKRRMLHTFIGKVAFICLVGSVNLVFKFLGQPGETRFQPGGDEISSGVPMAFNTKLTEPKGK